MVLQICTNEAKTVLSELLVRMLTQDETYLEVGDHGSGDHYLIFDGVIGITPKEEAAIRAIKEFNLGDS